MDKLLAAAQEVATQHASMPPADLAAIFIALNRCISVHAVRCGLICGCKCSGKAEQAARRQPSWLSCALLAYRSCVGPDSCQSEHSCGLLSSLAVCRFSSAVYPGELGFLDNALRSCHQVPPCNRHCMLFWPLQPFRSRSDPPTASHQASA